MRSGISATTGPDRFVPWQSAAALLLATAVVAIGWRTGTGPVEQAVLAARYSARVSLGLFLIAYLGAPIARLRSGRGGYRPGPVRRRWFVAFALAQLAHLVTMVALFAVERRVPHPATLAGGGLGAMLLVAMLATLNGRGRTAVRLRRTGLDYLWLTFAATYVGRLFDQPDRRADAVFALVLITVAGAIRLMAAFRTR